MQQRFHHHPLPLDGCRVALSGNFPSYVHRSIVRKFMEPLGAVLSKRITSQTTHLITTDNALKKPTAKVRLAKEFKVYIISLAWLKECWEQGRRLREDIYILFTAYDLLSVPVKDSTTINSPAIWDKKSKFIESLHANRSVCEDAPVTSRLSSLPPEIQYEIWMMLEEKDIIALLLVSKLLAGSVKACSWWRKQLERQFGLFDASKFPGTNWHQVYTKHRWGWRKHERTTIMGQSIQASGVIRGIPGSKHPRCGILTDG